MSAPNLSISGIFDRIANLLMPLASKTCSTASSEIKRRSFAIAPPLGASAVWSTRQAGADQLFGSYPSRAVGYLALQQTRASVILKQLCIANVAAQGIN